MYSQALLPEFKYIPKELSSYIIVNHIITISLDKNNRSILNTLYMLKNLLYTFIYCLFYYDNFLYTIQKKNGNNFKIS